MKRGPAFLHEGEEQAYLAAVPRLSQALADLVAQDNPHYDAVVCPPSTRADLYEPYNIAISARLPQARDLSAAFERLPGTSAGRSSTLEEVQAAIMLPTPPTGLHQVRSLLVIDDVFARGFTATVISNLLRSGGSSHQTYTVACALVVDGLPPA